MRDISNMFRKLIMLFLVFLLLGCSNSFLDVRPVKNQLVPSTLEDFQSMLDHTYFNSFAAYLSMIGGEEFNITQASWDNFPLGTQYYQKNIYCWADNVFEGAESQDYSTAYNRILICNIVLDGLERSHEEKGNQYKQIKGTALFHRARFYYHLAQIFSRPYSFKSIEDKFGLPVYLSSSVAEPTTRYTLEDTYTLILKDLLEASDLLPLKTDFLERADKASCYGLLSRVYLQIGNFEQAINYSSKALALKGTLLDYNFLDHKAAYPFPINGINNPEILFMESTSGGNLMARTRIGATDDLLSIYEDGDLRRILYFLDNSDGRKIFKGSYMGSYSFFIGLAVDELYLIRAEANAFLDNIDAALSDINLLRRHRIDSKVYKDINLVDRYEVLQLISKERRRELAFRNRRWEDLRRWNAFMDEKVSLFRRVGKESFKLDGESEKWTWPLPDLAIQLGGYEQNPR